MVGSPVLQAGVTDAEFMSNGLNRFTGGKDQLNRVILELCVIATSGLGWLHSCSVSFLTQRRVHEIRASLTLKGANPPSARLRRTRQKTVNYGKVISRSA